MGSNLNINRIIVLPRWRAEAFDCDERCRMISITDPPPFGGPAEIRPRWYLAHGDLLRLEFDDVAASGDTVGGHVLRAISTDQARQIAEFVVKSPHPVLVVHCEAGASRSPSVAMAVADSLGLLRDVIEWGGDIWGVPPNGDVYLTTCAEFMAGFAVAGESPPASAKRVIDEMFKKISRGLSEPNENGGVHVER